MAPHRDSLSGDPNLWLPLLARDPIGAFAVSASTDVPLKTVLGIGVGNSLEALLGACLLQRVAKFQPALDRLWDVLGFVALAALFAITVGAMMGVASLWWGWVDQALVCRPSLPEIFGALSKRGRRSPTVRGESALALLSYLQLQPLPDFSRPLKRPYCALHSRSPRLSGVPESKYK